MTNDQEIIKELREQLEIEITVKKNEVLLNKELKEHVEKLNLHIETLNLVNDKYSIGTYLNKHTKEINVIVHNNSHKKYRSSGKNFKSVDDAILNFKNKKIKEMLLYVKENNLK